MLTLTPAQAKIAKSNKRFRFIRCGRRFGKTEFAIEDIVATALHRTGKVLYIAPTQSQARDIIWDKIKQRTKDFATKINEQQLEIRVPNVYGEESVIMLGSWEKVENLRGNEFVHIVLDEVREMKKAPGFMHYWKNALKPTLLTTKGTADFLSTPNGYDHFYELEQEAQQYDQWGVFHFTSYDNPHNEKEELERLAKSEPDDVFAQEYLAEYRTKTGLVFKEFKRERHIYSEKEIDVAEVIIGVDFGYSNPAAALTIAKDRSGSYWITDEWYERGRDHLQIAEYVDSLGGNKVYPDPASPEAIKIMRDRGVNVMDVRKGADSIKVGISKIRQLLKLGRLHIHASCVNTIWEFENYEYPKKKLNQPEPEVPIKENDHAIDALRYAILMDTSQQTTDNYRRSADIIRRRRSFKPRGV